MEEKLKRLRRERAIISLLRYAPPQAKRMLEIFYDREIATLAELVNNKERKEAQNGDQKAQ